MHNVKWTRKAKKDYDIAVKNGHRATIADMLNVVKRDPYEDTPGHFYEQLKGDYKDTHTRRIDYHNRFAYQILPNTENIIEPKSGKPYDGIVKMINMWGHFPNLKK